MRHQQRFTAQKIAKRIELLESLIFRKKSTLGTFFLKYLDSPTTPPPLVEDTSTWDTLPPHTYWAKADQNFILRTTFTIPEAFNADHLALYLPLGEPESFSHPESLIYIDGEPLAASDRHHQTVRLPVIYADGRLHTLALHGWSGYSNRDGDHGRLFARAAAVVELDPAVYEFAATTRVALGAADTLADDSITKYRLLTALDDAFRHLDLREPFGTHTYASVEQAQQVLNAHLQHLRDNGHVQPLDIVAAGHAHIDLAWLWTTTQTRQKAQRTFHTVLHLMEHYPQYVFTQSQPQLYEWIREDDPALFARIQAQVAAGRWEPIGGMWVEADCNIPGNESLVRQFVYGVQWFREHFGAEVMSPVLWLPDVFGYSWALPQIMKKCGVDYFMTIKIGWNQYNRLPYDSFWWQGIDGSRVLTHFSTAPDHEGGKASTYNAVVTPDQVLGTWRNFQQKAHTQPLLISYGYGDGGGGPTPAMLDNLQRMTSFPGLPRVRQDTVLNFFRDMEQAAATDAASGVELPTWNGELYLEYHRGTYTTQTRTKQGNRRCEVALHNAEFLATWASVLHKEYPYPYELLRRLWRKLLLNQFHDILPGSSITPVYEQAEADYAEIETAAHQIRDNALAVLSQYVDGDFVLVNPTSFGFNYLVEYNGTLPQPGLQLAFENASIGVQTSADTTLLAMHEDTGTYSLSGMNNTDRNPQPRQPVTASERHLENTALRIELNAAGDIIRIVDKLHNHREVLPDEQFGNQLIAYDDRPLFWDAWDIDIFHDDNAWASEPASSITVIEDGPQRATIEINRKILNSTYTQRISLSVLSYIIDFELEIDWRERNKLLKVLFPTTISAPEATYGIQWGEVKRPTHRNTSWDWARFETVGHKWVSLREAYWGVSIISADRYGFNVQKNVMAMSLLRGPEWPDATADLGQHRFKYQLQIGSDDAVEAGYLLTQRPWLYQPVREKGANERLQQPTHRSFIQPDDSDFVIETVKRAEDGSGVIVRGYNTRNDQSSVALKTDFALADVQLCNMLEEPEQSLQILAGGRAFNVDYKPFEIITLRLVPAAR